jgi:hypothetical protein
VADSSSFLLTRMMEELAVELQHINIKLLLKDPANVDLEPVIPVFHSWIQDQVCDELLLDVTDYSHVTAGPGVLLVGHEADYSLDNTDLRLGLRYNRKAAVEGSNQDRLEQAARAALNALERLENEPSLEHKVRFNGRDIEVFVNDRLIAPNREESRKQLEGELRTFLTKLLDGADYSLSYGNDPRRLLSAQISLGRDFSTADLVKNLGPGPIGQLM